MERRGLPLSLSTEYLHYEPFIKSLPLKSRYEPADLLVPDLLIDREGEVEMFYAPHNEYRNGSASLLIVGITPGWTQMELAYRTAKLALEQNKPSDEVCKAAKIAARFSGAMRRNLMQMLDSLKLPEYFGLPDSEALFAENNPLLHTTSLLKYPVFVAGKNYTGHKPPLASHAFLHTYALKFIKAELKLLHKPLIIPLGKTVETMLKELVDSKELGDTLEEKRCLWGFPHPSGANGHRHKQFADEREQMEAKVAAFAAEREGLA